MRLLSRCYYHPGTSSVITDRNLLDSGTVSGLLRLLPEDTRNDLKYVTVCLEDGVAGDVDRGSLVEALEVFGQIRDTGANPADVLRALKQKAGKLLLWSEQLILFLKRKPCTGLILFVKPAKIAKKASTDGKTASYDVS